MSQRSHIAHSGSSEMSACSAAWSAPRSVGISSSPSSSRPPGQNQTASVSKVTSGRISGTTSSVEPSRIAFRWYAITCSVTETRPNWSSTPATRVVRERLLDRGLGVLLHLGVPVDARRARRRPFAVDVVERANEVLLAEVEVDGALVDGRVRALALDEPEDRAGRAVDDRERVLVAGAEREPSRRRVAPLPDEAGGRPLELRQQRRPLERLGAERLRVGAVSGPS